VVCPLLSPIVPLAVVTSNSQVNVEKVLGEEVLELVDYLGCGASIFGKKPKIRSAMKVCGVSAENVLCVGDEVRDAEVARELSLDFVAVSWGYTRADHLERISGVKMCGSIRDLLSIAVV
jgi:phosphoglycolate phosphatase